MVDDTHCVGSNLGQKVVYLLAPPTILRTALVGGASCSPLEAHHAWRMSGEQASQSASDAEFRATFSLLPHVHNIVRALAGGQGDPKAVEKAIGELEFQLHRCQQLLASCPYLDLSTREQSALLASKRRLLQEKSDLLLNYKDLAVLASSR